MEHILELLSFIKEGFSHHIIFSLGLLLIGGSFLKKIVEKIGLPSITGYIITGIIIGTSGLDLIHESNNEQLHLVSEITLSFIAVVIGAEFSFKKLKKYGLKVVILTLSQMFLVFGLISIVMILMKIPFYIAFILGAIGAATAPAAVVVLVEQMKIRGKFVDYLYGIVALDDAGTIIWFSIIFSISSTFISGVEASILHSILHGLSEIFYSLIIGIIGGFSLHFLTIKERDYSQIGMIALGIIFIATSISISLHLSALITNMTIGTMLVNLNKKNIRILKIIEPFTPPLYALFFAIAGVELNIAIFKDIGIIYLALGFVCARYFGKYMGIFIPAHFIKVDKPIRNYLGLALWPQAGVALGLAIFIKTSPVVIHAAPEIQFYISQMINIIIFSVILSELVGPPIAKYALIKSNEEEN